MKSVVRGTCRLQRYFRISAVMSVFCLLPIWRGGFPPVHPFLGLLLRLYGIQLHHLTPDCITHISCFITLCEGYLGIHPHLGWWCSLFSLVGRIEGEGDAELECGVVKVVPRRSDYPDLKLLGASVGWSALSFIALSIQWRTGG